MEATKQQPKVIAYVDGFNLYGNIERYRNKAVRWLDITALCESFLLKDQKLEVVKYFTASWKIASKNDTKENKEEEEARRAASQGRQQLYWNALRGTGVDIYEGYFYEKPIKKTNSHTWEEKQTDVKLAIEMVIDAMRDKYDIAFLLSGDTDFIPPIEAVQAMGKQVLVLRPSWYSKNKIPAKQPKDKLRDAAQGKLKNLYPHLCAKHQLPESGAYKGKYYQRPDHWTSKP